MGQKGFFSMIADIPCGQTPQTQATLQKVLIVEDEVALRFVISLMLQELGLEVLEAANADSALEQIRMDETIAVVFTDVRMPGSMDGLALAQLIARDYPKITVLVASGNLMPDEVKAGMAFFQKPYSIEDVAQAIVSALMPNGAVTS